VKQSLPTQIPFLAKKLLKWIAGPKIKESLLGDLQEEYSARSSQSKTDQWLWQEVMRTIPGLLLIRLRAVNFRSIGVTILLTFGAYLLLLLWGTYITRPIMIGLRDYFPESQSVDYMFWYLPVRLAGIFLVGAVIAFFAFRHDRGFIKNFVSRLMPLMLLVLVPQLVVAITNQGYSIADSLIRAISDGLILFVGATLGGWLKRKRLQK